MSRPPREPAELIWAVIVGTGLIATSLLQARGRRSLSSVAGDHPLVCAYLYGHFVHAIPERYDVLSRLGHAITVAASRRHPPGQGGVPGGPVVLPPA